MDDLISAVDQKNQYDDSEYDELKEKLLKAETQKAITRNQARNDTETYVLKKVYNTCMPLVTSAITCIPYIHFVQVLW